jgi:hypothetical protein
MNLLIRLTPENCKRPPKSVNANHLARFNIPRSSKFVPSVGEGWWEVRGATLLIMDLFIYGGVFGDDRSALEVTEDADGDDAGQEDDKEWWGCCEGGHEGAESLSYQGLDVVVQEEDCETTHCHQRPHDIL